MKLFSKMGLALVVLGLYVPGLAMAGTVSVSPFTLPKFTVEGETVPYLYMKFSCSREATFLEKLSNGMDSRVACKSLSLNPESNVADDEGDKYVVAANADGSFDVPEISVDYSSGKASKEARVCVRFYPAARIDAQTAYSKKPRVTVMYPFRSYKTFCTDGETHSFSTIEAVLLS